MTKKIWNVALYTRVSTDDKGQETERQVERLTKEVASWNSEEEEWRIVKVYRDEESAFKREAYFKRTDYHQMLADAKAKLFNCLVVESQDRFSRLSVLSAFRDMSKIVEDYGIRYKSISERLDSSNREVFDIYLAVMQSQANQWSRNQSSKVKSGIQRKQRNADGSWKIPHGNAILSAKLLSDGTVDRIIYLRSQGYSIPRISKEVYYWKRDNKVKKFVSWGFVCKVLRDFHGTGSNSLVVEIPKNQSFTVEVSGEKEVIPKPPETSLS